ncbi:hypothetical protein [Kordiimonas sp.]|uniref:hypothetical protein n=1 Tax=Kordiimonas sp. TaxID=1970157 RepID=UPI003A948570
MLPILAAIACVLPHGKSEAIVVDRIEINTVYGRKEIWNGWATKYEMKPVISQVILWRWSRHHGFVVADWLRIEPEDIYIGRKRVLIPSGNQPRSFQSSDIIQSHTTHDPERQNQKIVPTDSRRSYLK